MLENASCEFQLVEYLQETPSESELRSILSLLGLKASALVRKSEPVYKEQFDGKILSEEQWIQALIAHPILIERPILIHGNKAVIGRPPSRVLEIL